VAETEVKRAMQILGGQAVLRQAASLRQGKRSQAARVRRGAGDDRTSWTQIIRGGIPSKALESTARNLGVSINELSQSLGLPARTMHRRLAKGERLSPEETERSVRAARALARAQQLLGDDNGRAWLLEGSRGLGGDVPITLLDTADGFTAVMDELGRLEHGVIS
jgi:putative toxin-antitoxin system antitoxin component (TIGR02293 family)